MNEKNDGKRTDSLRGKIIGLVLLISLGLLFCISLAGVLFFLIIPPPSDSFEFEIAKGLLQLGTVAVIGAIISLLIYEYQQSRARADKDQEWRRQESIREQEMTRKALEYREELLKTTLAKTTAAYRAVKKVRRLLRAQLVFNAQTSEWGVLASSYDICFEVLNDAQFDLEILATDMKTSEHAFEGAKPEQLVEKLWSMADYLGNLIGEYEKLRGNFHGEPQSQKLSTLPLLRNFILGDERIKLNEQVQSVSIFYNEVEMPYQTVQWGIRAGLLHPNLSDYLTRRASGISESPPVNVQSRVT